jgi:hypothetical protein
MLKSQLYKQKTHTQCSDMESLDDEQIIDYLQRDKNNNIILTDSNVDHLTCSTITYLNDLLTKQRKNYVFYQCLPGGKFDDIHPIVRIPTIVGSVYVYSRSLRAALSHHGGWNFMTFDESKITTYPLISIESYHASLGLEGSYMSGTHCQKETNVKLSNIITYYISPNNQTKQQKQQRQEGQQQEQIRQRQQRKQLLERRAEQRQREQEEQEVRGQEQEVQGQEQEVQGQEPQTDDPSSLRGSIIFKQNNNRPLTQNIIDVVIQRAADYGEIIRAHKIDNNLVLKYRDLRDAEDAIRELNGKRIGIFQFTVEWYNPLS